MTISTKLSIGSVALTMLLAAAANAAGVPTRDRPVDVYRRAIAEYGLAPTSESLGPFLRALSHSAEQRQRVDRWIAELGDEVYAVRELAMRQLLACAVVPERQLKRAIEGPDPEIRWRAQQILRHSRGQHGALVYAVLKTVELTPVPGVGKELLLALPHLQASDSERRAALAALEAAMTADDLPLVARALRSKSAPVRAAGLQLLGKFKGRAAVGELRRALDDPDALAQLAAARELARIGDARSLPSLVALVDAEDAAVRVESHRILRAVTDAQIDFAGSDTPSMRQRGAEAWRKWLAQAKPAGLLSRPLDRTQPHDRTLLCQHARGRVAELDATGREVWSTTAVDRPWTCQGLPNGHRLVASIDGRQLVEFDADGQEAWHAAPLPGNVFGVDRLPNGHTLVALPEAQRLIELDPQGQVASEQAMPGRPMDARRLPSGHTLVALAALNQVVEFDAAGRETWRLANVAGPLGAQRLENGNTLVCEGGASRVSEFTPQGRVVWTRTVRPNPQSAQRLANGNTLISHALGAAELSPGGKVVWRLDGEPLGRAFRY